MTFLHLMEEIPEIQSAYNTMADARVFTHDNSMELDNWNGPIDPSLGNIVVHPFDHWNNQMMHSWDSMPEKAYYTAANPISLHSQGPQMEHFDPYAAHSMIPFAYELPRTSPTPSQGRSVWSDSVDSVSDEESTQDGLIFCAFGSNTPRHSLSRTWTENPPALSQTQDFEHITLKDVQRSMNPQELVFQHEEGSMIDDVKDELIMHADTPVTPNRCLIYPIRTVHNTIDKLVEQPNKSEYRPESVDEIHVEDANIVDTNANADDDEEEEEEEGEEDNYEHGEVDAQAMAMAKDQNHIRYHEADDDDYYPRSARSKPRRSTRVTTSTPNRKRAKIIKSTTRPKSMFQCHYQGCSHAAKDAQGLARHIATAHTRPFVCAFAFAGCTSTFGSKNEWKRHVSSQHLALHYWRCELGQCRQAKRNACKTRDGCTDTGGCDFNRKDLFTQHLRRMHVPSTVKRQNKSNEWDTQVKKLQSDCQKARRQPPRKTMCPVERCGQVFEGASCWNTRMEHVGKHLEREARKTTASNAADQGKDIYLIEYALKEKIIRIASDGSYELCRTGALGTDQDAECEFE